MNKKIKFMVKTFVFSLLIITVYNPETTKSNGVKVGEAAKFTLFWTTKKCIGSSSKVRHHDARIWENFKDEDFDKIIHPNYKDLWGNYTYAVRDALGSYRNLLQKKDKTIYNYTMFYILELNSPDTLKDITNTVLLSVFEPILERELEKYTDMIDPDVSNENSIACEIPKGFSKTGIGFRADSRYPNYGDNAIFKKGFIRGYDNKNYTLNIRKHKIWGTVIQSGDTSNPNATKMFKNLKFNDILNESAICVSRTVHGAAKFPSPEYTSMTYLYAVRVKKGFDTEAWQISQLAKDSSALWRPGEKVVEQVMPEDVLAEIPFTKSDYNKGASKRYDRWFSYKFNQTSWIYNSKAKLTQNEKEYLESIQKILFKTDIVYNFYKGEDFKNPTKDTSKKPDDYRGK